MKLILNTHSSNEYADGCEYAVVHLTPELAQAILGRIQKFTDCWDLDHSLIAMDYYDSNATFLDGVPESLEDKLAQGEPFEEVEYTDEEIEPCAARTECDRMVVMAQEVYWTCYPKHCDWQVETRPIPVDVIQECGRALCAEMNDAIKLVEGVSPRHFGE